MVEMETRRQYDYPVYQSSVLELGIQYNNVWPIVFLVRDSCKIISQPSNW